MLNHGAGNASGRDVETMNGEHTIQVGLLDALREALAGGEAVEEVHELLDRAREYSRLHFLSEELLMRRHAYPHHEEHVQEHQRLIDDLDVVAGAHAGGQRDEALDAVKMFRARLLAHIQAHDEELSRFIDAGDGRR